MYRLTQAGIVTLAEFLDRTLVRQPSGVDLQAWILEAEHNAEYQHGQAYVEVPARLHRLRRAEEFTIPAEGVETCQS